MRLAQRTTTAVAQLLHEQGMSHADAARATGMSKAYVQRRLSGVVEPNLTDLEDLAACAGMEVHIVFVPSGPPD